MPVKDIYVLGAGPAGVSTACALSAKGFKVYLVDVFVGGNYCSSGSIISNAFLYQSYLYSLFREKMLAFLSFKDEKEPYQFDFKKMKKNVEGLRNKFIKTFKDELESSNVEFIEGMGFFEGENLLRIDFKDNTSKSVKFFKAVVATGSFEEKLENIISKRIFYPSNVFSLEDIPKSVTVIGGGFVGCEYATFFKRLGSKVKIVEKQKRILSSFDEQVTKKLQDYFKKDGIELFCGQTVGQIERIGNKSIVFLDNDYKVESEEVFVCIGRAPNLSTLCLEKAGVEMSYGQVVVDDELKTSNKDIYIAGDATGTDMFVNWAYNSGDIVVSSISNTPFKRSKALPKVAYLDPEIASVGYTEEDAEKIGFNVASIKYAYENLEKSIIVGFKKGYVKVVYDKDIKRVLGAHIIGKGAVDLISIFSMIIQSEIKIDSISSYIFNHPTYSEVLTEIGNKVKTSTQK